MATDTEKPLSWHSWMSEGQRKTLVKKAKSHQRIERMKRMKMKQDQLNPLNPLTILGCFRGVKERDPCLSVFARVLTKRLVLDRIRTTTVDKKPCLS